MLVYFSGGGVVSLGDGSGSGAIAEPSTDTGTIMFLDNTDVIEGAGQIGDASGLFTLTIFTDGTIDASVSGQSLILDTGDTIVNFAQLEATNGCRSVFYDTVDNSVNTATIKAAVGSTIELNNATLTTGSGNSTAVVNTAAASGQTSAGEIVRGVGTSANPDNATITNNGELVTGGTFTLDDDTVNGGILTGEAANASYNVGTGNTLALNGVEVVGGSTGSGLITAVLTNAGTITLGTSLQLGTSSAFIGSAFVLELNDGVGAGDVSLNGATISALAASETFENNGNTISGVGQIGDGITSNLMLDNNAGTIEALGGALTIASSNTITNNTGATLEAGAASG